MTGILPDNTEAWGMRRDSSAILRGSLLALLLCRAVSGGVVINEIDVDQIGTDHEEFIELFNDGKDPVDFDATPHVLVLFNGDDATPPVIDGSYRAVQLTGVIEPNGFLTVGGAQVPNVDIVLGESNLIQNGTDAVALYLGSAANWSTQSPPTVDQLVDAVVYHTDDEDDPELQAALGVSEQFDEWNGQASPGAVFSIARSPDGGAFQTGATPTPSGSNDALPPVFALPGVTLLHQDDPEPTEVELLRDGGVGVLQARVLSLPSDGTLLDDGVPITGSGNTALPYTPGGFLTYAVQPGFTGVDVFEFDVVDGVDRVSEPAVQELAVQIGGVVISEIMHSPGTFNSPQDQRIYEYIEIFNHSEEDIALTRLDGSVNNAVDTLDNLILKGAATVIPAWTMRIIAPGGLTEDSDQEFACEWGLAEEDIVRIPHEKYENLFNGTRVLLFGLEGVLIDAVNLGPGDFWTWIPGASQSVKEAYLVFFGSTLDSEGNDHLVVWPYTGPENLLGSRVSNSGIGNGSPGFVPVDYNEDFVPLPPCELPPLGACCLPDGCCAALSLDDCFEFEGDYQGDHLPCGQAPPCPQPQSGACCTPNGDCLITNAVSCSAAGGTYDGDDVPCDTFPCDPVLDLLINELEYNQAGTDTAEYIELYGQSGLELAGYQLVLYNGQPPEGIPYHTIALKGVIPADGHFVIGAANIPNVDQVAFSVEGIQNGSPDGIALIDPQLQPIETIAYGGGFVGTAGPAAGEFFVDIGVQDAAPIDGGPAGEVSLQRIPGGVGSWTVTSDQGLGPDGTPGEANAIPLPAAYGACCLPDGSCLASVEEPICSSAGGDYVGDATQCDETCPVLIGPCCLPNGECVEIVQDVCEGTGGTFQGQGQPCDEIPPCPQPKVGACCLFGGQCIIEDAFDCDQISGDYRGDAAVCTGPDAQDCGTPVELKINEIYRNDAGIDDREFVELFGSGGTSLDTFAVIEIEGDYGVAGQQGRIDRVWLLDGRSLPGDGYFVLGDQAVANVDFDIGDDNQLENGTATLLLIQGYDATTYPPGTDIDYDNDGVVDQGVDLGTIIDGIAIVDSGIDEPEPEVDRTYFDTVIVGPDASDAPAGVARRWDGLDTGSPTDFCELSEAGDGSDGDAIPTPGTTNTCLNCAVPGDANDDGAVDLLDFGPLQVCFTGSTGSGFPISCRCLDFDGDGDIDLADFSQFQETIANGRP